MRRTTPPHGPGGRWRHAWRGIGRACACHALHWGGPPHDVCGLRRLTAASRRLITNRRLPGTCRLSERASLSRTNDHGLTCPRHLRCDRRTRAPLPDLPHNCPTRVIRTQIVYVSSAPVHLMYRRGPWGRGYRSPLHISAPVEGGGERKSGGPPRHPPPPIPPRTPPPQPQVTGQGRLIAGRAPSAHASVSSLGYPLQSSGAAGVQLRGGLHWYGLGLQLRARVVVGCVCVGWASTSLPPEAGPTWSGGLPARVVQGSFPVD